MTKWQRINYILGGVVTFLLIPILLIDPEVGCALIVVLLGLTAALKGARMLIYYAAMARYMVGGKMILFEGIILLDFGIFTLSVANIPTQYIMLYLLMGRLFYGLIDILRAREMYKRKLVSWQFKLLMGAGNISIGILCLAQLGSNAMAVYIYCVGIAWSALGRIASAFRRSAVVYVAAP